MRENKVKYSEVMLRAMRGRGFLEHAPSCRLVKGKITPNPGHAARCISQCRQDPPILLMKHHSVEGLELWHCPACWKKILIRVQRQPSELHEAN